MGKTLPVTPSMRSFLGEVTTQMEATGYSPVGINFNVYQTENITGLNSLTGEPLGCKGVNTFSYGFGDRIISEKVDADTSNEKTLKVELGKKVREFRKFLDNYNKGLKFALVLRRGNYKIEDGRWHYKSKLSVGIPKIEKPKKRLVIETGYPIGGVPPGKQLPLFRQF